MRIAIVHEWLDSYAGSERVVEQLLHCWPEADLFAVCDFLPEAERGFLGGRAPRTTFIQRLPFARTRFRWYLGLMPLAIEQLDLSGYDLVLSSSHAVAKGVLTGPDQLHVSYIHSPMRYAWDLQHQYLRQAGLERGLRGAYTRWLLHRMRGWDRAAIGKRGLLPPCGRCRELLLQIDPRNAECVVLLRGERTMTLGELLPEHWLDADDA